MIKNKRALVTGGLGFIGSHVIDWLCENGFVVFSVDVKNSNDFEYFNPLAKYFQCDIAFKAGLIGVFAEAKPDYVIHCAAQARIQKGIDEPEETFHSNCVGTMNVLLCSQKFNVKKVVYSASSSAYGAQRKFPLAEDMAPNPLNPYAVYKEFGEKLCFQFAKYFGVPTVCLRYFNVYGPRQPLEGIYSTVIAKFLHQWIKKESFTIVPDGKQSRDFTYVSDVVGANVAAMLSDVGGGHIFNVGTGKDYSIFQLAELIGGKDYPWKFIEKRKGEAQRSCADNSKARRLLKWRSKVSLKQGIALMKEDIKNLNYGG